MKESENPFLNTIRNDRGHIFRNTHQTLTKVNNSLKIYMSKYCKILKNKIGQDVT